MVMEAEKIVELEKKVGKLEEEMEAIKNSAIGLPFSDRWEWALTRQDFILQPQEKKLILKDAGRGWCRGARLSSNRPDTELHFVLYQKIGVPQYEFAISAADLKAAGLIHPAAESWVSVYDEVNNVYISQYHPFGWLGLPHNLAFEVFALNPSAFIVAGSIIIVRIAFR